MRYRIALCLCALLAACAGAPPAPPTADASCTAGAPGSRYFGRCVNLDDEKGRPRMLNDKLTRRDGARGDMVTVSVWTVERSR